MKQAPLDRDQQIKFVREATARHAERVARWAGNEMINEVLCEPVEVPNVTKAYVRSDLRERKCA